MLGSRKWKNVWCQGVKSLAKEHVEILILFTRMYE
jgi:hypothetical protein